MPITSISELMKDSGSLQKFNDAPDEARKAVLGRLSKKFADENTPDEVRSAVVNKVLLAAKDIPPAWKDVPAEAFRNIPSDAVALVKNIWTAARHPQQTAESLEKVIVGGFQKLIPGEQQQEASFDAIVDFAKNRFIGDENLRRTVSQEPVQFFADIEGLLSGLGAGLKVAGVANVAQKVSAVGKAIDPLQAATKVVANVGSKAITPLQQSFVKSGVRFPKPEGGKNVRSANKRTTKNKLANEVIERDLDVSQSSLDQIAGDLTSSRNKAADILSAGDRKGIRIKKSRVASDIDETIRDLERFPIDALDAKETLNGLKGIRDNIIKNKSSIGAKFESELRNTINKSLKRESIISEIDGLIKRNNKRPKAVDTIRQGELLNKFKDTIGSLETDLVSNNTFTKTLDGFINEEALLKPTEVQAIKVLLNKQFKFKANTLESAISVSSKENIRIGVKQALEETFPELVGINKNQKILLELEEAISTRLDSIESAPTFSSKNLLATGAGSAAGALALGASPGVVAGSSALFTGAVIIAGKVLNNPNFQIKLAKALHSINKGINTAAKASGGLLNQSAFQSGRLSNVERNK